MDLCEFEPSLAYKSKFQDNQDYTEKLFLEKQKREREHTEIKSRLKRKQKTKVFKVN